MPPVVQSISQGDEGRDKVTAAHEGESPRWVLGESDFGGPMVEHWHATGSAVAYVLIGRNGGEFAQCSDCAERIELEVAAAGSGGE
jgi:hypothetical protein